MKKKNILKNNGILKCKTNEQYSLKTSFKGVNAINHITKKKLINILEKFRNKKIWKKNKKNILSIF